MRFFRYYDITLLHALNVSVLRYSFASGSPDNIKQWKFPDGVFMQNLNGHNSIINSLAVNEDGVLVSAGRGALNKHIECLRVQVILYLTPCCLGLWSSQQGF